MCLERSREDKEDSVAEAQCAKVHTRRWGHRGNVVRSCQPLTFTQSETKKPWRALRIRVIW